MTDIEVDGEVADWSRLALLRAFFRERDDPEPFYRALADRSLRDFPFPLAGSRVLDLACGPGHYSEGLSRRGAQIVALDLDEDDVSSVQVPGRLLGDGARLPFPDQAFDGVFCSNMLEHTPEPGLVLEDISRVVRPGGWAWVSWTNWYSPWGGHAIAPLHYLGPERGQRAWKLLFGEPKGKNLPNKNLWVTHISRVLRTVEDLPGLELLAARPRYYPSQEWILRVPGLREVAAWNCELHLRRRQTPDL